MVYFKAKCSGICKVNTVLLEDLGIIDAFGLGMVIGNVIWDVGLSDGDLQSSSHAGLRSFIGHPSATGGEVAYLEPADFGRTRISRQREADWNARELYRNEKW
ncbi:hypothetical protein DSO57_1036559 [Entomophthora muscae]|uniref:Uncharacterized protein n=1 Tax=Entomophthora muscae TaxID=34485 RepID=A0ACC2RDZ0_9FUNG|nr:hypothetical protein DSO57_1036559 [Entomophthora muscae]